MYRIAGFSCEDFNLAIGLIRNIKIRKVFNYVVFNSCACTKLANRSVIYWSSYFFTATAYTSSLA